MSRRLLVAFLVTALPAFGGAPTGKLKWQSLFDGASLNGWEPDGRGKWAVEDGVIVGRQNPTTHLESWLFTKEEFTDFVLTLQFEITSGGNSGVFLRIPKVRGHPAHIGYEMQIWDKDREYPTGSFYGVAKGAQGLQRSGWNEVQVVFTGSRLFTAINGQVALAIDNRRRAYGRIGFQVHGGVKYTKTEVRFRDIYIAPLPRVTLPKKGRGPWKTTRLDGGTNEGVAVFDVNGDNRLDILCGEKWYRNPTWQVHPVRDVRTGTSWELPCDVNGDGLTDVISGTSPARELAWYQNPRSAKRKWPEQPGTTLPDPVSDVVTLDLDGNAFYDDFLPASSGGMVSWIRVRDGKFIAKDLGKYGGGAGIGYGFINKDKRVDVITGIGWYEAPANRTKSLWRWHKSEFKLNGRPSTPILTTDVNDDGRGDIVYGDARGYGLWWLEQGEEDEKGRRAWTEHLIEDTFSQLYCIAIADVNGDDRDDIIAGKRWRAQDGRGAGGLEPTCLYWYEHDGAGERWTRHLIDYNTGAGCGMGLKAIDIDNDNDIDIVAPGRGGLFLFLNQGVR